MRDPQRARVYQAEKVLEPKRPNLTTRDAQQYANRIVKTPAWARISPGGSGVTIQRMRARSKYSQAQQNHLMISLAPMHHNRMSVTHEMAHILVGRKLGNSVEDHGPEYVWVLRLLLKAMRPQHDFIRWAIEIERLGVVWDGSRFA